MALAKKNPSARTAKPEPNAAASKGAARGDTTPDPRSYPSYKVKFSGPGLPKGTTTGKGECEVTGPHTCRMFAEAGVFNIMLRHNSPLDSNPNLIIEFEREPDR